VTVSNRLFLTRGSSTVKHLAAHCRVHRATSDVQIRNDIEVSAWRGATSIPPESVEAMTLNETVALLHSWSYFERWWSHGFDGPSEEQTASARPLQDDLVAPFVVSTHDRRSSSALYSSSASSSIRPRSSPLDEIIE
jgi:hypothetical protein